MPCLKFKETYLIQPSPFFFCYEKGVSQRKAAASLWMLVRRMYVSRFIVYLQLPQTNYKANEKQTFVAISRWVSEAVGHCRKM